MSYEFKSIPNFLGFMQSYNFIEGRLVKFLYSIPKDQNERFYDLYDLTDFQSATEEQRENLLFAITNKKAKNVDDALINEYYSFEDEGVEGSVGRGNGVLTYGAKEIEFFRSRYEPVEPQIQVNLNPPIRNFNTSQQAIETNRLSFNSLSSMQGITQESFTVSATTGSATELITTATETISDVGGLSTAGRSRAIESENVTVPGAARTETVRTSGY